MKIALDSPIQGIDSPSPSMNESDLRLTESTYNSLVPLDIIHERGKTRGLATRLTESEERLTESVACNFYTVDSA